VKWVLSSDTILVFLAVAVLRSMDAVLGQPEPTVAAISAWIAFGVAAAIGVFVTRRRGKFPVGTVIGIVAALLVTACDKPAEVTSQTSNSEFDVGRMFEHDGCEVFRFYDAGRAHYYVRCAPGAARVDSGYLQYCGKNCTHYVPESIETVSP
jgi:hypothetical protein